VSQPLLRIRYQPGESSGIEELFVEIDLALKSGLIAEAD
jgi:hypothetical protein